MVMVEQALGAPPAADDGDGVGDAHERMQARALFEQRFAELVQQESERRRDDSGMAEDGKADLQEQVKAGKVDLQEQVRKAIILQSFEEVNHLVENGASLLAEYPLLEPSGKQVGIGTALDLAMFHKRYKLIGEMLEWSGSLHTQQEKPCSDYYDDIAMLGEWGDEVGLELEETGATAGPDASIQAAELAKKSRYVLAWAARDGQAGILTKLLQLGADANQLDEKNRSALLLAAMRGRKRCVAMLLQAGALEQEPCPQELASWLLQWKLETSCHESSAATEDVVGSVHTGSAAQQTLIAPSAVAVQDRWANVQHTRAHWSLRPQGSPLQLQLEQAIDREGTKQVRELISQEGALTAVFVLDPSKEDYGNALDLMIKKRRFSLAMECASLPEAEELARQSSHSLAWAASAGQLNLVRELTRLGAPVGQCDQDGRSALLLASIRGRSECVAALLEEVTGSAVVGRWLLVMMYI
eukprot:TRINITY_DN16507_c0_g1_i1.p1 TRINITY_DN16507_c0_g1~~TRINITY_DN16507_c0_g1_i1.p1  ORF type:complete len:547 (-),score=108.31 TRINITY_DN16507_c0_g1_i1:186-1598(-)